MSWRDLKRERPRSLFVRLSFVGFALASVSAWIFGRLHFDLMFSERAAANTERFMQRLVPLPIRKAEGDWALFFPWLKNLMLEHGFEATAATLAISVAAIVLAFVWANALMPFATRTLTAAHPYLKGEHPAGLWVTLIWGSMVWCTRGFFVITRAIPEYIFAFLLVGLLGANAWPGVLALALHNTGILGRLGAETAENLPPDSLRALRVSGATRRQVLVFGIVPIVIPRLLVYFFYRWETCVREATIIGMLGISSLGFFITDARARIRYDDLLAYIVMGAVLVLIGDVVSNRVRRWVREVG
jgi:phosphonate transport system permease protein